MIVATTSYLRFVHGWDPVSALLGASPGAMAQVMVLSAEFGADLRGVAIVQIMRVLLVTIGLPGGLALFGFAAAGVIAVPDPPAGRRSVELVIRGGLDADGARHDAAALSRAACCSARWRDRRFCTAPARCMRCCRGGSAALR